MAEEGKFVRTLVEEMLRIVYKRYQSRDDERVYNAFQACVIENRELRERVEKLEKEQSLWNQAQKSTTN